MLITPSTTYKEFSEFLGINGRLNPDNLDSFLMAKKDYRYILIDHYNIILATQKHNSNSVNVFTHKNSWFKNKDEIRRYFVTKIRSLKLESINK